MKNITFVIALAILSSTAFGQKVNFTGNWKLNSQKSEMGDQFSLAPNSMVVKHSKKLLEVEKNSEMQGEAYTTNDSFTLDGEECENPAWMEAVKKSKALLDKKSKVLTITSSIPWQDGSEIVIIEKYSMDGDNLVLESNASSSMGDLAERFVFDKE